MNRQQERQMKREEEKLEKTFQRLSLAEKQKIADYVNKNSKENTDRAIEVMIKSLTETMIEFKISQKKIDEMLVQISKRMTDEVKNVPKVEIPHHIVLTKNELSDLAEQTLHDNCKNCHRKESECTIAKIFRKCGVPESTCKLNNCRYAYKLPEGEVNQESVKQYENLKKKLKVV